MLNLHRLRLLDELSRRGTIAEVARTLAFSPSTVSQQLSQLESEVGLPLIEPSGRRVRLTAAGVVLVRHATGIFQEVDRAESALSALQSEIGGEVKVASFQTAAIALLPEVLTEIGRRYPGLVVYLTEIQPDSGAAALLSREFDLVLGEHYPGQEQPTDSGIEQRSVFMDPLRVYLDSRWHPQPRQASLAELSEVPWVLEPRGKPARAWAESACRAAGFEPVVRYESADLLVQTQLVETGHAAAFLPDLIWQTRSPLSHFIDVPGRPARNVYTAVRSGTESRPVLAEFRRVMESVTQRLGTT